MKRFLLVIIAVLALPSVLAATIQGDIYQFDLSPATDIVVEIDTTPHQLVVAKNGSYSINVPAGSYTLTATEKKSNVVIAQTTENITVSRDGSYTLDLILFPSFVDDTQFDADIDVSGTDTMDTAETAPFNWVPYAIAAGAVILIVLGIVLYRKNRKTIAATSVTDQPQASDLDDVVSVIRKLGGRATQKELRKELPYSEAKVSLILTELEHAGKVTKIKRGRANVIILK